MSRVRQELSGELAARAASGRNPPWVRPAYLALKRAIDVAAALVGLAVLSPLLLAAAVAVGLSSPGPILFRQTRVGRHFRPFQMYKFRTMIADAPRLGPPLTAGNDARITAVGYWLRRWKIDELPQLLNVLVGDMSLVGPRPEVPHYVRLFADEFAALLQVRPGITDLASIAYRHESAILARATDPEREYVRVILPEKLRLAREYLDRRSLALDLALILQTICRLAR